MVIMSYGEETQRNIGPWLAISCVLAFSRAVSQACRQLDIPGKPGVAVQDHGHSAAKGVGNTSMVQRFDRIQAETSLFVSLGIQF